MIPPTSIDGTDITGATIDGTDVQQITVDGDVVFSAGPSNLPVAYSNLVAWYPFDSAEYGGSNADDVTAILGASGDDTAYDGTVSGANYQSSGGVTDINAGANSGAFNFDGSNDFIDLGLPIDFNSDFTICAWCKPNTTGGIGEKIFGAGGAPNDLVILDISQGGFRFVFIANGDLSGKTNSSGSVNTNTYQHVAGTLSGTSMTLYVDGSVLRTDTAFTTTLNLDQVDIGRLILGTNDQDYFDGNIEDARIYNTALSGSQINQIYQNTQP